MKRTKIGLLACATLCLSYETLHPFAHQGQPATCKVVIAAPRVGEQVGANALVSGRANLPTGTHLWVFVHRRGLRIWWPQGGGAAEVPPNGEWAVLVNFGQPGDVGAEFEVKALVVNDSASASLDSWVKAGETTGNYPGLSLPPFVPGCEPALVTVRKTR